MSSWTGKIRTFFIVLNNQWRQMSPETWISLRYMYICKALKRHGGINKLNAVSHNRIRHNYRRRVVIMGRRAVNTNTHTCYNASYRVKYQIHSFKCQWVGAALIQGLLAAVNSWDQRQPPADRSERAANISSNGFRIRTSHNAGCNGVHV